MENGNKEPVGMDSEHLENKRWEGREREDGEERMEEVGKGENTEGGRQSRRIEKGKAEKQRGRRNGRKEEMEEQGICQVLPGHEHRDVGTSVEQSRKKNDDTQRRWMNDNG